MSSSRNLRLQFVVAAALVIIGIVIIAGAVALGINNGWQMDAELTSGRRTGRTVLAYLLTAVLAGLLALGGGVTMLVRGVRRLRADRTR